jgi:hypothetical protein
MMKLAIMHTGMLSPLALFLAMAGTTAHGQEVSLLDAAVRRVYSFILSSST